MSLPNFDCVSGPSLFLCCIEGSWSLCGEMERASQFSFIHLMEGCAEMENRGFRNHPLQKHTLTLTVPAICIKRGQSFLLSGPQGSGSTRVSDIFEIPSEHIRSSCLTLSLYFICLGIKFKSPVCNSFYLVSLNWLYCLSYDAVFFCCPLVRWLYNNNYICISWTIFTF